MSLHARLTGSRRDPQNSPTNTYQAKGKQGMTMKRSLLTILALTTLAFSVKAEGLHQQITELQAEIKALKETVATLSSQLVTVRNNPVLAMGPFVSVDLQPEAGVVGPNIFFRGANIHIVSGSGNTWNNRTSTGLGNLIIGYDEAPSDLVTGERNGCHNLVIGPYNTFQTSASWRDSGRRVQLNK